ncbi:MAG: carboxypeptidase-like regulatory domain-containing protein [Chloroflexota bacterium]
MKPKLGIWLILALAVFALACNLTALLPSSSSGDTAATSAAATQLAVSAEQTAQANAAPSSTEAPQTGSISGNLSYPSEFIPPLRVVAINTATNQAYSVDTAMNQTTYQLDNLPAGSYFVIAYYQNLAGGYSQFVTCGLSVDCSDHTLIPVTVNAGEVTPNINPGDWYAPADAFPPNPLP